MAQLSVFYQTCPVCGRSLRMPVEVFGRKVTCVHCGGEFRSTEQAREEPARLDSAPALPLSFVASCLPTVEAQ